MIELSKESSRQWGDLLVTTDALLGHLRKVPDGIDEERWLFSRKQNQEWVDRKIKEAERNRGSYKMEKRVY
jgi:hypothetical protein